MVAGRLGVGSRPTASNKYHKGEKVVMEKFNVNGIHIDNASEVKELRIAKCLLSQLDICVFAFQRDEERCETGDGFDVYYEEKDGLYVFEPDIVIQKNLMVPKNFEILGFGKYVEEEHLYHMRVEVSESSIRVIVHYADCGCSPTYIECLDNYRMFDKTAEYNLFNVGETIKDVVVATSICMHDCMLINMNVEKGERKYPIEF